MIKIRIPRRSLVLAMALAAPTLAVADELDEIGRASCRERV